jgi:hypothetical protein
VNVANIVDLLLEDEGSWDFVSSITDIDVTNAPSADWSSSNATASISWHLDMDVRSWGVKEFNPVIKVVDARIIFDDYSQEQESEHEVQIKYDESQQMERPAEEDPKHLAQFYDSYTAEAKRDPYRPSEFAGIRPTSMEIDMARRHIVVYFG